MNDTPVLSERGRSGAALRVEGLGLQIGGATILGDVDLEIAPGSLVGVIGPNGAGKTTLFNAISGVIRPTSGRILLDGEDITALSVPKRARAGLGRTFQTSSLFPKLSILENVRESGALADLIASIPGTVRALLSGRIHSRVPATILIAIGAFIPTLTDSLNRFGSTELFQVGKFLGVVFLFAGFLVSIEVFREIRIPLTSVRFATGRRESPDAIGSEVDAAAAPGPADAKAAHDATRATTSS